jgi:spore germination protein KA
MDFTLGKRGRPGIPGGGEDVVHGRKIERRPFATKEAIEASRYGVWSRDREEEWQGRPADRAMSVPQKTPFGGMSLEDRRLLGKRLSRSLDQNLKIIKWLFRVPRNKDLSVREFRMEHKGGTVRAAAVYMPSIVDGPLIRQSILTPLIQRQPFKHVSKVTVQDLRDLGVTAGEVEVIDVFSLIVSDLTKGHCFLLVDGDGAALSVDSRTIEHRPVAESPTEAVVKGPHHGFVEDIRANVGLIRGYLQTPQLISELHIIGARSHTTFAIMYVESVANPKLVDEVRRRITSIKTSAVLTNEQLVELIKDQPADPFPTIIATERPDKIASMLSEGHVAIVSGSPAALLVPTTIWSLMQSSEDYYVSASIATALRLIRWFALLTTIYAAAMYTAIVTYHPEMIPTELMFAIAATREGVPFPAFLEALLMEVTFELIREGGIRIPTVVGPTIGIVGAVVLGQAAVQAGIVSPILVVVVAVSGLSSYAISNYDLGLWARLVKFMMMFAAALFGIPGITFLSIAVFARVLSLSSFGIPITAPVLPYLEHSRDIVLRGTYGAMTTRPGYTRPLDPQQMPEGVAGSPAEVPSDREQEEMYDQ